MDLMQRKPHLEDHFWFPPLSSSSAASSTQPLAAHQVNWWANMCCVHHRFTWMSTRSAQASLIFKRTWSRFSSVCVRPVPLQLADILQLVQGVQVPLSQLASFANQALLQKVSRSCQTAASRCSSQTLLPHARTLSLRPESSPPMCRHVYACLSDISHSRRHCWGLVARCPAFISVSIHVMFGW